MKFKESFKFLFTLELLRISTPLYGEDLDKRNYDVVKIYGSHDFPKNFDELVFIKHLSGGDGGVWIVQDDEDQRFTIKSGLDEDHFKEEILADAIYQTLDVFVPPFALYRDKSQKLYRLSLFINSHTVRNAEMLKAQIAEYFVIDAFMSNWDVVANDLSNIILDTQNRVWHVDNGGCLRYRALGERKLPSVTWDPYKVLEIDNLRNPEINTAGAEVYGHLSNEKIGLQVSDLVSKVPRLWRIIDEIDRVLYIHDLSILKEMLSYRLSYLTKRWPQNWMPIQPSSQTSAGVFIISYHPIWKKYVTLLGLRSHHQWWGNLGGKSDVNPYLGDVDQSLEHTACREVREESFGLVTFSPSELKHFPSHDLWNLDGSLYRMYIAPYRYWDIENIKTTLDRHKNDYDQEYTDYDWVPVIDILKGLQDTECFVVESGLKTVKINGKILHPPFYRMLQESPVLENLTRLIYNKPLLRYHTPQRIWPRIIDPEDLKKELAHSVLNYADVLAELKERFRQKKKDNQVNQSETPYTQSQAYLKLAMGEDFEAIKDDPEQQIIEYFSQEGRLLRLGKNLDRDKDRSYLLTLQRGLEEEEKHDNWLVFYHATDPFMAFLNDVFSHFRTQLKIINRGQITVLRALDTAFKGIENVHDFIKIFQDSMGVLSNYSEIAGRSYQDLGLSVNVSLFGEEGNDKSCSYFLFYNSLSQIPPNYEKLFNHFMYMLGLKTSFSVYKSLFDQFHQDKVHGDGSLYQIFINPEIVDEVAYMASSGGDVWDFVIDEKPYYGASKTLACLRKNPQQFDKLLKDRKNKLGKTSLKHLQARLFLNPKNFHNPEDVQIITYRRHPLTVEEEKFYHQKLRALVKEDLAQWLVNQVTPAVEVFAEGMPAVQRLFKYVYQGNLGFNYSPAKSSALLPMIIQRGDVTTLERMMPTLTKEDLCQLLPNLNYYESSTNRLSPLGFAIFRRVPNHLQIAQLLVKHGAKIHEEDRDEDQNTPLFFAISIEIAEFLLNSGVDVNAENIHGHTALHLTDDLEMTRLFLQYGAKINCQDKEGYTPLHLTDDPEKARLLIEKGADLNLKSYQEESPLETSEGLKALILCT